MLDWLTKDIGIALSWGEKALGTVKAPAWVAATAGAVVTGKAGAVWPYLQKLVHDASADVEKLLAWAGFSSLKEISQAKYPQVRDMLMRKINQNGGGQ